MYQSNWTPSLLHVKSLSKWLSTSVLSNWQYFHSGTRWKLNSGIKRCTICYLALFWDTVDVQVFLQKWEPRSTMSNLFHQVKKANWIVLCITIFLRIISNSFWTTTDPQLNFNPTSQRWNGLLVLYAAYFDFFFVARSATLCIFGPLTSIKEAVKSHTILLLFFQ